MQSGCLFFVGFIFLSFYLYQLNNPITHSTISKPIIKYKAKLSKNNIHLRGDQLDMIASVDCQPLCCQNTFYKRFILLYKLTITTQRS